MSGLVPFNRKTIRRNDFFQNMIEDFFNDDFNSLGVPQTLSTHTFKLDVKDNGSDYLIEAELPGVKKEEVDLELYDGKLTIAINRSEDIEEESKGYIHKERRTTSMQRSLYLGDASSEGISAKLEDGILRVNVPKIEEEKQKSYKIDIE